MQFGLRIDSLIANIIRDELIEENNSNDYIANNSSALDGNGVNTGINEDIINEKDVISTYSGIASDNNSDVNPAGVMQDATEKLTEELINEKGIDYSQIENEANGKEGNAFSSFILKNNSENNGTDINQYIDVNGEKNDLINSTINQSENGKNTGSVLDNVALELKNIPLKDAVNHIVKDNNLSASEKFVVLNQVLNSGEYSEKDMKSFVSSKLYNNIMKNALEEQWFVRPEELEDKEKAEELYSRIERQMAKIQSILNGNNLGENLKENIKEVRSNISFMNELNQYYNFAQIPLKMHNQNASGDLYVYMNKKAMKNSNDEITAHIHLDMDNLGPTDVFVRLKEMKLSTQFILSDERSLDLVMANINILTDRLNKKGYETNITVKGQDDDNKIKDDFVNNILGEVPSSNQIHRYSFDVHV